MLMNHHLRLIAPALLLMLGSTRPLKLMSADPPRPDIVGIYPGMPIRDAAKALRQHNPNATISVGSLVAPELSANPSPSVIHSTSDANGTDYIVVELTVPPNEQVVWAVSRRLSLDKEQLRDSLIEALRQKYGQESSAFGSMLVWLFGENGRKPSERETAQCWRGSWLSGVAGNGPSTRAFQAGTPLIANPAHTARPGVCDGFVWVQAGWDSSMRGEEYVRRLHVTVVDNPLAQRASQATIAAMAKGNTDAAAREREKAAKQAPPKL